MQLSERLGKISASPTLALNARAKKLRAEGVDVVNFTAGEPDFDTPRNIKEAAIKAIRKGRTKYTDPRGMPELRQAISDKLGKENGLEYPPDQILVSCGGKHSLFNALQALCNPGDEVLIPAPYWVSYPEQVRLCGARPVFVRTLEDNGFGLMSEDLEKAVTPKTKAMILNSPSNPTGGVIEKPELERIAGIAAGKGIFVISDEIYEHLVYEGKHVSIAGFGGEIREKTLISNGASKSYSMTGWRIGWTAGPKEVIRMMGNFQSHTTSNPASISQHAYLAAITGPQGSVKAMRDEFRKRRDFIVKRLNGIPGISCVKPKGSFYVFPNVSGCFGPGMKDSTDLSMKLLEEARVAVVPGAGFGSDKHVRISYACSMETIEKGLKRIAEFLE